MNNVKAYRLNPETIQSLEDVRVIFGGLNLTTYSNVKDFEILKKYFTEEIVNEIQDNSEEEYDIEEVEECDTCS